MEKIRQFLENGKWKQWKKSDWLVMALVGVLFMVIALPTGKTTSENKTTLVEDKDTLQIEGRIEKREKNSEGEENAADIYASHMEEKLKRVLAQMDGVGRVEVMITLSDKGEYVVEKDAADTVTATSETDSAGGSRGITENSHEEKTVYVETGDETYPYVQKEKLPEIAGVMVVAEGGGNPKVVSDISDAVKALFPVEAHRIKVVKMCSKEE